MNTLDKLLAEATPGPWDNVGPTGFPSAYVNGPYEGVASTETIEDAALIVYLRNHAEDIAALIEAGRLDHYPSRISDAACRCGFMLTHCKVYQALAPFRDETP